MRVLITGDRAWYDPELAESVLGRSIVGDAAGFVTPRSPTMSDETFQSFCNVCQRRTRHRTLHVETQSSEIPESFWWSTKYKTIQCCGCDEVSFCVESTDEDSLDPHDGSLISETTYYPPLISRSKPSWFSCLPEDIRKVMDEVYVALHADCRYLATLGARTAIDMLIVAQIGDIGTFAAKIQRLESDGHITQVEADLIQTVVEAGNASAHRGFSPDAKSIHDVMDILESVLDKFYATSPRQARLAWQAEKLKGQIPDRSPRE